MSIEQGPEEGPEEGAPTLHMPDAPFLHTGIFALGAGLVTQVATSVFLILWLQDKVGRQEALRLSVDNEGLMAVLEGLRPLDLFELTAAGLGAAFLYTVFLWRALRRGTLADIGLVDGARGPLGLLMGATQAVGLMTGVVALSMASGLLSFEGMRPLEEGDILNLGGLGMALGFVFLAALSEEVFTRGYMYQVIRRTKGVAAGLVMPTLYFGLAHLFNPEVGVMGLLGTGIAGLYFALVTLRDGHLWRAAGLHWGWNFTMGFVFSLPVSGIPIEGLVAWRGGGLNEVWLGGGFGPEAGILGIAALGLGCAYEGLNLREDGIPELPEVIGFPVEVQAEGE